MSRSASSPATSDMPGSVVSSSGAISSRLKNVPFSTILRMPSRLPSRNFLNSRSLSICQMETLPLMPVSRRGPALSLISSMSARECAGSVDICSVDCRGWRAARCSASPQETVVFPTPPFPTTKVSLATDGFYRKGREGRKEFLERDTRRFVHNIDSRNSRASHLIFKFLRGVCDLSGKLIAFFSNFASFAVNPGSLSSQTKLRHQRQMVRRQQRHAAAMQQKFFQRQITIKIHVIKMHDGQHAGVRALAVEMQLDIDALKRMLQ